MPRSTRAARRAPVGQRDHVEVVSGGVPPDHEPRLDSENLLERRDLEAAPADRDLFGLHGSAPDELADPGLDPVEAAQNEHLRLDPRGDPTVGLLERAQHVVEPLLEIRQDVIVIERHPVPGVVRGSRSADQDGIGEHLLQARGSLEHLPEVRVLPMDILFSHY